MPAGDIKISKLKCGDIDLTDFKQATYGEIHIFEDILNMYGPSCEIQVIDHSDALGKTNLNGSFDKDIEIGFSMLEGGGGVGFKFKFFRNKNLDDTAASEGRGSLKYKTYKIRGVPGELLSAQSNYVKKSYEDATSKMVEDIIKNNFKSDKSVEVKDETKGKRRFNFNNEHPLNALRRLNSEHVSQKNKSSAYVLFQQSDNSSQKYIFSTFEELFTQSAVTTLKQKTTLDFSSSNEQDKANAILSFKVSDSFFTPSRAFTKAEQHSYNHTTGIVDQVKQDEKDYKVAGGTTKSKGTSTSSPSNANSVPVHTLKDSSNDKSPTGVADARKNRLDYVSHLSQNFASLEVIGNSDIKLGSIVKLEIPKKADSESAAGENQFNAEALVVSIKHKIRPLGETPRYTMVLGVVKGSFKEKGGDNG
jgi:hypothetical protein